MRAPEVDELILLSATKDDRISESADSTAYLDGAATCIVHDTPPLKHSHENNNVRSIERYGKTTYLNAHPPVAHTQCVSTQYTNVVHTNENKSNGAIRPRSATAPTKIETWNQS